MHIGGENRKITILVETVVKDSDTGEKTKTWATLADVWAEVVWAGGKERFDAEQKIADKFARMTIYYRTDVDHKNRVSYGGDEYEIVGFKEMKYKQELELSCEVIR